MPEELFHFFEGTGFFESETLLFDGEAFGAEVASTEGGEITTEIGEAAEFGFRILAGGGEGTGDGGVAKLEVADEFGAHFFEDRGIEIIGEVVLGKIEGGLAELPVAEAG